MLKTKLTKSILHTTDNYIKALEKAGILTVGDLLNHFPRDYEDRTNVLNSFSLINIKEKNTILVKLLTITSQKTGNSEAVWFNRKFLANQLASFSWRKVLVSWKVKYAFWKVTFQSPEVETDLSKVEWEIVPIYSDLNYIPSKWIIGKIKLLKDYIKWYNEKLPESIVKKYNFISRWEAIYKIHFPKNKDDIEVAKYRLAYEELFNINYKAISSKYEKFETSEWKSIAIPLDSDLVKKILSKLPFSLTDHQKIALFQVLKDMEKPHSMQRLLEWDVWTGKTIIALVSTIHSIIKTSTESITSPQPSPLEEREQKQPHPNPLLWEERGHDNINYNYNKYSIRKCDLKSPGYVFDLAKGFRKNPTKSEDKMWQLLKNNKFNNLKFRRQHPIWRYIADFYCEELNIIIELDWKIHDNKTQKEYDLERDILLNAYWFIILRLTNNDILEKSTEYIYNKINIFLSSPPLLQRRGVRGEVLHWENTRGEISIQVSIMAPTEILARQHFNSMQELLFSFGLKSALLVWSTTAKQKKAIKADLKSWNLDVIIGTHALVQEDVLFHNLWYVIIDEQHRFGVKQRETLESGLGNSSGIIPHSLNMTATPIPRTLALTLYWDQDLSVISEYPKGRKEIVTKVAKNEEARHQIELLVRNEVEKWRQVFWVSPLVEESEKIDLANAINMYDNLVEIFFPFKVWLVHGKMKPAEKKQIMQDFADNKIQILSSTSVIEVWVDIPNATIMCIEWAERFGLSQLHQFRWRIGRWKHQSYCYLFPSKWNFTDRLRAMERTNNWFELSEIDLELRWAGEIYWLKQSWVPDLKIADLKDLELISQIREDIEELFKEN